jgi:hypothetical protein
MGKGKRNWQIKRKKDFFLIFFLSKQMISAKLTAATIKNHDRDTKANGAF